MPVFRRTDGNMTQKPTGGPALSDEDDCVETTGGGPALPDPMPARPDAGHATGGQHGTGTDRYTNRTQMPGFSDAPGFEAEGTPEPEEGTQFAGSAGAEDPDSEGHRPVVGWLVVTEGPGVGRDVRLLAGRNEIGRSAAAGTPLAFGDRYMSRRQQVWISYDHRGDRFTIAPGTSGNVSYLEDEPIEGPTTLHDGSTLRIGKTTLKFAAFCGARRGERLHHWDGDQATPEQAEGGDA